MPRLIYTDQEASNSLGHIENFGITSAKSERLAQLETDLSNAGILSLLDRMWLFRNNNIVAALTDLTNQHYARPQSGMSFDELKGYKGDGTAGYIDLQFIPSVDTSQATDSIVSMGCYLPNTIGTGCIAGSRDSGSSGTPNQLFMLTISPTDMIVRLNNSGSINITPQANSLISVNRNGTTVEAFIDGTLENSRSITDDGALTNANTLTHALNNDEDGISNYYDEYVGMVFVGGDLTGKQSDFATAVNKYFG